MNTASDTFAQRLHLAHPLVQAPMAGVQGHALAAAACNAGALGSIPAAMLTPQSLDAELAALKVATNQPFNVNFFCHTQPPLNPAPHEAYKTALAPLYTEFGIDPLAIQPSAGRLPFSAESFAVIEKHQPAVVSFHFGLPDLAWLPRIKAWGAQVWSSATTVAEAMWLEQHGVDAVIAQGLEAGGHRGHFLSDDLSLQLGSFALLPQVVQAVKLPVIAAGGIADSAGVRAALALGASAVQVGTAFMLCNEASTSPVHRKALQSEAAQHTQLTNVFTGRPARGIQNRLMRELGAISPVAPPFPLATAAIAPLRAAAEAQGSSDFSPLWSGQNASGCAAIPAAHLVKRLMG